MKNIFLEIAKTPEDREFVLDRLKYISERDISSFSKMFELIGSAFHFKDPLPTLKIITTFEKLYLNRDYHGEALKSSHAVKSITQQNSSEALREFFDEFRIYCKVKKVKTGVLLVAVGNIIYTFVKNRQNMMLEKELHEKSLAERKLEEDHFHSIEDDTLKVPYAKHSSLRDSVKLS